MEKPGVLEFTTSDPGRGRVQLCTIQVAVTTSKCACVGTSNQWTLANGC